MDKKCYSCAGRARPRRRLFPDKRSDVSQALKNGGDLETFLGGAGTSQEVGAQVLSVRPGQNGGFGLSDVSSQVGKENCQCPRQTCSARSQPASRG